MKSGTKKRLAAGLTAGAMMLSITGPALAQTQVNTGNLISALNNISVEINNLEALNNLTVQDIQVVDVDNVLNNNNVRAFNNALNRNNVEILTLRNVLNNNEILNDFLNNNNIDIDDVVAIDVLSGGDIVIFVQ